MAAHHHKKIFLIAILCLSAAVGCVRQEGGLAARSTLTLYPTEGGGFPNFVGDLKSDFSGRSSYEMYVSVENGYQGEYVELKKEGQPIFDFVEVPEADSYAVSFYDTSSLSPDDLSRLRRAFERNFLEIRVMQDGGVKRVKLELLF